MSNAREGVHRPMETPAHSMQRRIAVASQLVILAFDGSQTAAEMLNVVRELEDRALLEIDDAVVASRPAASDRLMPTMGSVGMPIEGIRNERPDVEITQTASRRKRSALLGGGVGFLAGWLFGGPVGGAAVGAVIGSLRDRGVNDKFIRELSDQLQPDTSAIFLLVQSAQPDQVLEELRPYKGRVIHTTVAPEVEQALRKALEQ
jgi:uncharacterized membrane protein